MTLQPDEPWFYLPDGTPARFARFATASDPIPATALLDPSAPIAILDVIDGSRGIADLSRLRACGWAGECVRRWEP